MKINFYQNITNTAFRGNPKQYNTIEWFTNISLPSKNRDIFEKDNRTNLTCRAFERKQNKLEILEFRSLDETQKEMIRRNTPLPCYLAAYDNVNIALEYKKLLDESYGKDNYVFISIGTSPSLIGKVFECMGVETKYLPMSGLKDKNLDIEEFCKNNSMENYGNFLKEQGLSKERIKKSKKHFVFCDYTDTGLTLERFQTLMEKKFGIEGRNVHYRSLNRDLKQTGADNGLIEDYIESYLTNYEAELYSPIDHLGYFMTEATSFEPQSLTRHNDADVKFFNFSVMDNLDAKHLLKENPLNRKSL